MKKLLEEELQARGEAFSDIQACVMSSPSDFIDSAGTSRGRPFIAWTATAVYFPFWCDGAIRVGSVPRNPGQGPAAILGLP